MIAIQLLGSIWLAALFVYTGSMKLAQYRDSIGQLRAYEFLPGPIATFTGILLPWIEVAVGLFLLVGFLFPSGPLIAAGLGLSFLFASSWTLGKRASASPCGCTGRPDEVVTKLTVARALMITLVALGLGLEKAVIPGYLVIPTVGLSLLPAAVSVTKEGIVKRLQFAKALPD